MVWKGRIAGRDFLSRCPRDSGGSRDVADREIGAPVGGGFEYCGGRTHGCRIDAWGLGSGVGAWVTWIGDCHRLG